MLTYKQVLEALKREGLIDGWTDNRVKAISGAFERQITSRGHLRISDETYGKESYLYVVADSRQHAHEAAAILALMGGNPDWGWNGIEDGLTFEIRVRHFKGQRWWE